ncbi:amphi-Trp domain-containing protein [Streptomyces bikiniensis]|uniref:Amphi-Trp domain-containing protein n=1 Tax=Streptomyces bikiniensis TaxID=1896 RepID=A0ABW8D582_STRBI
MKDLKFEQKRSVSRLEAAEQLMALATALKEGGDVEWDIGHGRLGLHVPDELRTEIEVETGEGEVELEIELKWPVAGARPERGKSRRSAEPEEAAEAEETAEAEEATETRRPAKAPAGRKERAGHRKAAPPEPKPKRSGTGTGTRRSAPAKRSAPSS